MGERAPYSRVYWTVRNDERLTAIYSDDHHWATWNRLLIAADMAWPAPADVPSSARPRSLRALADAGVIELLPGGLFRFHGLDDERGRRRQAAAESAGYRTVTERLPNGTQTVHDDIPDDNPNGLLAEPSLEEPSLEEPRHARQPTQRQVVHQWLATHGASAPVGWVNTTLNELIRVYGATRVIRAFEDGVGEKGVKTSKQFVQYAERWLGKVDASTPAQRNGSRGPSRIEADSLLSEIRAGIVARYGPEEVQH